MASSRPSWARRCSPRTSPAAPARRSWSSRRPTRRVPWRPSSPTSRASTRRASRSRSCTSDLAYLEGTLTSAPDSDEAFDTVDRARDAVHAVPDADALVGGTTAVNLDVQRASADDNLLIIPIILLVVLLVLVLLLRSVLAPLVLDRHGRALVRRGHRRQRADLQVRLRLRRGGHVVPAVRLRVPGRPGDRLQHLPHDPGPGGGDPRSGTTAARWWAWRRRAG